MALPHVVSREEWEAARKDLLAEEKQLTRARDALNTRRRELPMVEITKDYTFTGHDGREASLLDLFAGYRQLIVGHFMFDPEWDVGCPSCTAGAQEVGEIQRLGDEWSLFFRDPDGMELEVCCPAD